MTRDVTTPAREKVKSCHPVTDRDSVIHSRFPTTSSEMASLLHSKLLLQCRTYHALSGHVTPSLFTRSLSFKEIRIVITGGGPRVSGEGKEFDASQSSEYSKD